MKKLLLSSIICLGVLTTNVAPAFATIESAPSIGGQTLEEKDVEGKKDTATQSDEKGNFGTVGSSFTVDAKATNVNVTVPTTAPFVLDENGDALVPRNFRVKNNSAIAGIYLESISLDSKTNGWEVVDEDFDLKTMDVDSKKIRVTFGKKDGNTMKVVDPVSPNARGTSKIGSATFASGEIDIEAEQTQKLDFKIDRGAFSQAVANGNAFDMTLRFRFQ